ncbi:DNA polymerase epsilon catalytic subunit A [Hypsibius exemplaris]|uniref:DNA polymerase epsilon catalytic subunit n=1 Tax=Hypsibius exemplaris TaxID=2072580 RepID=A0A1W0XE81_HYPEX|nr:DNA polymerase epsilon catalytic subunit A [Hypsibius exemplaris]
MADDDKDDGAVDDEEDDVSEMPKVSFSSREDDRKASNAADTEDQRLEKALKNDSLDAKFGFERYKEPKERTGFMLNMQPNEVMDEETKKLTAVVDYFFMDEMNSRFKISMPYQPYFFLKAKPGHDVEASTYLQRKYSQILAHIETVWKEDLDLLNHLSGLRQKYIKLSFWSMSDLAKVKKELMPVVRRNRERQKNVSPLAEMQFNSYGGLESDYGSDYRAEPSEHLIDIREYDVPFHMRVAIDKEIFAGHWYTVRPTPGGCTTPEVRLRKDILGWPDMVVCAYDIETTKPPLKFPDAATDQIMMISYMISGKGFLIVNRAIVAKDIESFEYNPTPEYEGKFEDIFNEPNEAATIKRFFQHILATQPVIFTTYNGDFFDWPFVEARAKANGFSMYDEIGFQRVGKEEYLSRCSTHMDCFKWVQRDSYLPVGSQNLKAVCKAKLRYNPDELDPELMVAWAQDVTQADGLARYSVSDAVATYYLYMKYVHPFILALSMILPLEPDAVLRKGSGTLCEALLMVQAFKANVIFPNKQESVGNKFTADGHLVESETYVGGHVEALESGIFRADIAMRFRMVPDGVQTLIDNIERTVRHAIVEEEKIELASVTNLPEIVAAITEKLVELRDHPMRNENPLIYHLDVAAMYPNIILTYRLQPSALATDVVCASCLFNRPQNRCRRKMKWTWRGEHMPAKISDLHRVQQQLENEKFPSDKPGGPPRAFHQLTREEKAKEEKKRLTEWCRGNFKKVHITREEGRESVVCQRENSFYVDTVRMFRDCRYEYKDKQKKAKRDIAEAQRTGNSELEKEFKALEVVYDSLQLAHKCILNSFYGYVMRRGARWYSMEMAGIVCHTGGAIIKRARQIVEQIGRPLELDTDGIWCAIPKSFPETFDIEVNGRKRGTINYPGAMLNVMVRDEFSNDQYQEYDRANKRYDIRTENSIGFEVDGPYLAMILPASKEEGKRLKKRYAVFNFDGSLAELKGFEVKRRGELQLIKQFQTDVFGAFLLGGTLQECYAEVAKVADQSLDIIFTKGATLDDDKLYELISESRNMSKKITEYGSLKSTAITTARRLAEFLGASVIKDAGLACRFIIARKPEGAPIAERAIPLAIWKAPDYMRNKCLRSWQKIPALESDDIRDILDWDYYLERISGTIQKIITIPAALQSLSNPVPRVPHPDWLRAKVAEHNDAFKQQRITDMFKRLPKTVVVPPAASSAAPFTDNIVLDIESLNIGQPIPERHAASTIAAAGSKKRKAACVGLPADVASSTHWRDALGPAPAAPGSTAAEMLVWLTFHRKKWAWMRKNKQQRKKSRSDNFDSGIRVGTGASVESFVRQTKKQIVEQPWQVVQIAETGHAGIYKLWLIVNSQLHSIRLKVSRVFYINRRVPKDSEDGQVVRRVTKLLPRSKHTLYLYEYRVDEQAFLDHQNELLNDLTDPMVEGIYETQMPLMFRVLTMLGSRCRVYPTKRKEVANRTSDVYLLEDLERVPAHGEEEYLSSDERLNFVYLYHHESDRKSVFGLFFIKEKKVVVYVQNPAPNPTNELPIMKNLFNRLRQHRIDAGTDEAFLQGDNHEFSEIKIERDAKKIDHLLEKTLSTYLAQPRKHSATDKEKIGPTVLVLHSRQTFSSWLARVPSLGNVPVISTHVDDDPLAYRVIGWQTVAAKMMLEKYLDLHKVLEDSLDKARYFDVPLGNLPKDTTIYGCDLLYARILQKHNMVMWGTSKDRPDFGGKETDDIRLIAEDEEKVLQVNNPGFYGTCTVHVEVDFLAVCAVLLNQHLHSQDGVSAATSFERAPQTRLEEQIKSGIHTVTGAATYDEAAQIDNAFSLVGAMVRNIFSRNQESLVAEEVSMHIFRWLRSPTSLLYDPALHRMLIGLMRKMLIRLVGDCRKFGCHVVYACNGWIIFNTDRGNVNEALAQVRYTMHRVCEEKLFRVLVFSPRRIWTTMLWLDASNFAALRVKMPEGSELDRTQREDETFSDFFGDLSFFSQEQKDTDHPHINHFWNLATFLPDMCRTMFQTVVGAYVHQASRLFHEYYKVTSGEILSQHGTEDGEEEAGIERKTIEPVRLLRKKIETDMTDLMLQNVVKVTRILPSNKERRDGKDIEEYPVFPEAPGSVFQMQNPALELIKSVCKVLSLHEEVEKEVRKMKRDLLKMIGIGEFAPVAEWKDPCVTYVVPEVICSRCNCCRDLDLCKDQTVMRDGSLVWKCTYPKCGQTYDSVEIEQRLFVALKKMNTSYHLQDLRCPKCRQIFERHVSRTCSCGGQFKNTIPREAFLTKMRIFENISRHFRMETLHESVSWILALNYPAVMQ